MFWGSCSGKNLGGEEKLQNDVLGCFFKSIYYIMWTAKLQQQKADSQVCFISSDNTNTADD